LSLTIAAVPPTDWQLKVALLDYVYKGRGHAA
jgi:hypothetical protein